MLRRHTYSYSACIVLLHVLFWFLVSSNKLIYFHYRSLRIKVDDSMTLWSFHSDDTTIQVSTGLLLRPVET